MCEGGATSSICLSIIIKDRNIWWAAIKVWGLCCCMLYLVIYWTSLTVQAVSRRTNGPPEISATASSFLPDQFPLKLSSVPAVIGSSKLNLSAYTTLLSEDQTSPYFSNRVIKRPTSMGTEWKQRCPWPVAVFFVGQENNHFKLCCTAFFFSTCLEYKHTFLTDVCVFVSGRLQESRNIIRNVSPVWTAGRLSVMETLMRWWRDPSFTGEHHKTGIVSIYALKLAIGTHTSCFSCFSLNPF